MIFSLRFIALIGGLSLFFVGAKPPMLRLGIIDERPADAWLNARLYPDSTFNMRAYEDAVKAERLKIALRGPASEGFDNAWQLEGPQNIGGRVNTLAMHPQNEQVIYAGYSRGGIFKTTNGGANWAPIFDGQNSLSISHIALNPSNPDEIFVGTGDLNIGSHYSIGNGIWKSPDGGETWESLGLEETGIISRIIVHPSNGNIVYAASMGKPSEKNTSRGLYKSTDGGTTWSQSLFVADSAGIIDLVMDPFNTNTLYAASWNRMRTNSVNFGTGPNASIYKTTDGGGTWTKLTNGLPSGNFARIGLAISAQTQGLLFTSYVGTNFQLSEVYKTTNGGTIWTDMEVHPAGLDSNAMGAFGWYFGQLRINPADDNDIFVLGVRNQRTLDGGLSWFQNVDVTPDLTGTHADNHDLIFAPSGDMILATDGGVYRIGPQETYWNKIENNPTTQFYRVGYNPHLPEYYFGGAQDNGTLVGNASTVNQWNRVWGGDGFQMRFHPTNSMAYFYESQNGGLVVTNDDSQSWADGDSGIIVGERRNWDFPYIISAHNPEIMYCGGERFYKNNSGSYPIWEPISEDMTDGLVYFSSVHSITCVAESPINLNYLYSGTGDGNVWRTKNQGITWESVHQNGLPNRYISSVHASPEMATRVFATVTGYKDGDYEPHVFRSDNQGDTWTDISSDLPQVAVNDIFIMPDHGDSVLFVGTDIGVYGTKNGGQTWERLGNNMPFIPVFDVELNPEQNRLIAGTFARSIQSYDITALLLPFVGTFDPLAMDISVYPNPATDWLRINLAGESSATLRLFDLSGRQLLTQKWSPAANSLPVNGLPAGTYILQVEFTGRRRMSKSVLVR
jgi:photosystem II stability/assembly factor-like uncharacterized protein